MRTPQSTFFWRLLVALDVMALDKLAIEAEVDKTGLSALDLRYAIASADSNGTGKQAAAIREWMADYVKGMLTL